MKRVSEFAMTLKKRCVLDLGEVVERYAQNLAKQAPNYSHILGEEHYIKPLAKRFLLDWKGRKAFSEGMVVLHTALRNVRTTHTTFGITEDLELITGDSINLAKSIFDDGRVLLLVIACANCIQCMSGAEQKKEAAGLLARRGVKIPQVLESALKDIVESKSSASARRRGTT